MHGIRLSATGLAFAIAVSLCSAVYAQAPDSFIDQLGAIDVGESTINGVGSLPPIPPVIGPISSGLITGQIEADGTVGAILDGADASANWDLKFGVLQIGTGFLVDSGMNWFVSDLADEGFVGVTEVLPGKYHLDVAINLESTGLSLDPTADYIIFAALAFDQLLGLAGPTVPDPFGLAADDVIAAATDVAPWQLHIESPLNFGDGFVQQLVTSRIIPVVPEPTTLALLLGAVGLIRRRTSR